MTIYEHGYREARYAPSPAWRRLWPIARMELRALFRGGWGVAAFVACLVPSIVNLVLMLLSLGVLKFDGAPRGLQRQLPRGMQQQLLRVLPDHIQFHVESIVMDSLLPILIITAWVSCRAVAKDRAMNALELYWTRGISPRGYFVAKWFGSFLLLSIVTVLAPFLVWATGVLVAEDWGFLQDTIGFMPRVLLAHALFAAAIAWMCVCLSSLVRSAIFASMLWLLLVGLSGAMAGVLSHLIEGSSWTRSLGLWQSLSDLDRCIAGAPLQAGSAGEALAGVFGYLAVLTLMMLRTMRRQEAIA